MQLVSLILRLGGSVQHTVPKDDVTPGEILILRHIHGEDAVIDIRPTKLDKNRRQEAEWERLSVLYDRSGSIMSTPGEEHRSIMAVLFPGALRKLPTTLEEIGLGELLPPKRRKPAEEGRVDPATVLSPKPDAGDEDEEAGVPAGGQQEAA